MSLNNAVKMSMGIALNNYNSLMVILIIHYKKLPGKKILKDPLLYIFQTKY